MAPHAKFRTKHELPFPLLANTDHAVSELYEVWKEKSMYGRKYMGVERSTFVIGGDGVVVKALAHRRRMRTRCSRYSARPRKTRV